MCTRIPPAFEGVHTKLSILICQSVTLAKEIPACQSHWTRYSISITTIWRTVRHLKSCWKITNSVLPSSSSQWWHLCWGPRHGLSPILEEGTHSKRCSPNSLESRWTDIKSSQRTTITNKQSWTQSLITTTKTTINNRPNNTILSINIPCLPSLLCSWTELRIRRSTRSNLDIQNRSHATVPCHVRH